MGRDGTEAGVVLSVTCEAGAGAGSKKTIAELPQEPIREIQGFGRRRSPI